MADTVLKIIDVGIAIKKAVDTARYNQSECESIAQVVDHVCGLVRMLHASAEPMVHHPVVAAALWSVLDSMKVALQLVISCGKKNVVVQLITAQSMAKKLARVQREISQKISLGTLAVTVATAVNLSRPQLPGGLDSPYPCTSLPELLGYLGGIFNGKMTFTSYIVTDQTSRTLGFAMRAAGVQAMFLTASASGVDQELEQELFGFGHDIDFDIIDATSNQLGLSTFTSLAMIVDRLGSTLCAELLVDSILDSQQRLRIGGVDAEQQPEQDLALLLGDQLEAVIRCHAKDEFDAQLAKGNEAGKLVVIYISWSLFSDAVIYIPVFAECAKEYPDSALFLEVEIQQLEEVAPSINIVDMEDTMPRFVFIRHNVTLATIEGVTADDLRKTIEEFIYDDAPAASASSSASSDD